MKLAIIVWDLSVSGGTQRQALELSVGLQNRGHRVTVYCNKIDRKQCYPHLLESLDVRLPDEPVAKNGFSKTKLPLGKRISNTLDEVYWPYRSLDPAIKQLAHLMQSEEFDVINAHDSPAQEVAALYKTKFAHVPAVWMSNDMPWIFQVIEQQGLPGKRQRVKRPLGSQLIYNAKNRAAKSIKKMDKIVVLDNRNRHLYEKHLGISPVVVRSGIDIDQFKPRFVKKNTLFTVLATGILFPYRRFEDLIEAVSIVKHRGKKIRLNIIGSNKLDPAYGKQLVQLTKMLDLDKDVGFLGRVDEQELLKRYREADVFVFPNHNQTWGLAVFEALASGTPVIVSRTAGAHEVLKDKETALLVNPLSPDEIAEKLISLYDNSKLRQSLAKQGRLFVEQNLSWSKYTHAMLKIFEKTKG